MAGLLEPHDRAAISGTMLLYFGPNADVLKVTRTESHSWKANLGQSSQPRDDHTPKTVGQKKLRLYALRSSC